MKSPISRIYIRLLLTASLSTISLPVLHAEAHCPGSVASVTPRFVQRALIVIPVKIDQKGPFDFMVDTGSQITVIDPSLAAELNLKPQGSVGLVTVASHLQASIAELDTLEAGSHVVAKPVVVVQDLGQIQAADRRIRGVLGENFLSHFDVLIDYGRKLLCLDETKLMQQNVRGEHVPFVRPQRAEDEPQFTELLDISVRLWYGSPASSSATGFRKRRSHTLPGHEGEGTLVAKAGFTANWQREQGAASLCSAAATGHADRQPYLQPGPIRNPCKHRQRGSTA